MFPQWVFGYLQSKERYTSQDELLALVKEYRQRQVPLDGIVLDWRSWPEDLWGQKSLDPERFPQCAGYLGYLFYISGLRITTTPIFSSLSTSRVGFSTQLFPRLFWNGYPK